MQARPRHLGVFGFFLALLVLAACGSPFVKGWRNDNEDTRTPEEKCDAIKGRSWDNGSCVEDKNISLTERNEVTCKLIETAIWIDDSCLAYETLSEDQCARAANPAWTFYGSCMPAKRAACLQQGADFSYIGDRCVKSDPTPVTPPDPTASGFLALCQNPKTIDASNTIAKLLKELKETECDKAAKALSEINSIDMTDANIVDVSPLAGLPKLTSVILAGNSQFKDVKSLAAIPNLRLLDLSGTAVDDVSALAHHAKLSFALMDGTPLKVVGPKTSDNCPTGEGINAWVNLFCAQ